MIDIICVALLAAVIALSAQLRRARTREATAVEKLAEVQAARDWAELQCDELRSLTNMMLWPQNVRPRHTDRTPSGPQGAA